MNGSRKNILGSIDSLSSFPYTDLKLNKEERDIDIISYLSLSHTHALSTAFKLEDRGDVYFAFTFHEVRIIKYGWFIRSSINCGATSRWGRH